MIDGAGDPKMPAAGQLTARASNIPPRGVTPVPPPIQTRSIAGGGRIQPRQLVRRRPTSSLFRGIRYSDTPLKVLRDAGLNTLFVNDHTTPAVYDEAIREGFWLVPGMPAGTPDPDAVARDVARFVGRRRRAVLVPRRRFPGQRSGRRQPHRPGDPGRGREPADRLRCVGRVAEFLPPGRPDREPSVPAQHQPGADRLPRLAQFPPAARPLRVVLLDMDADAFAGLVPGDRVSGVGPHAIHRADRPAGGADSTADLHRARQRGARDLASGPTASWPTATRAATGCWSWRC